AGVTNMRAHKDLYLAGRNALAFDLLPGRFSEQCPYARDRLEGLAAKRKLDGLLARRADVGEAHAVGRKQRREGVNENARHAERVGYQAGMLAARAPEAVERVMRDVVAALDGNFLDRIGHVLDRDLDEAVGNVFGLSAAGLLCKVGEGHAHGM